MLLGAIVFFLAGFGFIALVSDMFKTEDIKEEGSEINDRIEILENILTYLEGLRLFIENQKYALKEQRKAFVELEDENQKLEKVVGINRDSVEALFQIQEGNVRKRIWYDRIIGFLFGLTAGSFMITLLFRIWDARNKNNSPGSGDDIYIKKEKGAILRKNVIIKLKNLACA